MNKSCIKCNDVKNLLDFLPDKRCVDGFKNVCRLCWNNRKAILRRERYRHDNSYDIKYYSQNKEKINSYNIQRRKYRYENDYLFRLRHNIRSSIKISIKKSGYLKKSKSSDILGCSYEFFKQYLESKFKPWMSWDNYGKYNGQFNFGWDIDHIIPISSAKTEEEVIKLNHYTNLQPLCSKVNREIKRDITK